MVWPSVWIALFPLFNIYTEGDNQYETAEHVYGGIGHAEFSPDVEGKQEGNHGRSPDQVTSYIGLALTRLERTVNLDIGCSFLTDEHCRVRMIGIVFYVLSSSDLPEMMTVGDHVWANAYRVGIGLYLNY